MGAGLKLFVAEANAELEQRLGLRVQEGKEDDIDGDNTNVRPIPRPKGSAGNDWSIQQEMGLGGSRKKTEIYKGLQVNAVRQCILRVYLQRSSEFFVTLSSMPA